MLAKVAEVWAATYSKKKIHPNQTDDVINTELPNATENPILRTSY